MACVGSLRMFPNFETYKKWQRLIQSFPKRSELPWAAHGNVIKVYGVAKELCK